MAIKAMRSTLDWLASRAVALEFVMCNGSFISTTRGASLMISPSTTQFQTGECHCHLLCVVHSEKLPGLQNCLLATIISTLTIIIGSSLGNIKGIITKYTVIN